jgi:hypothetical protein
LETYRRNGKYIKKRRKKKPGRTEKKAGEMEKTGGKKGN